MSSVSMENAGKRNFYIREIKRLNDEMQKGCVLSKLNRFELDEYIKLLDSNFLVVRLAHVDLVCDDKANEMQLQADYAEIEKIYVSLKAKLRSRSENLVSEAVVTSSGSQNFPEVKINWDKFSGKQDEWLAFYVNFNNVVTSSTQMDEPMKFKMLVDSTAGEAQALVNQYRTFGKAWEMLRLSYGNAFRQAQAAVKALMNIKAIEKRSIEAITLLVKQADGHIIALNCAIGMKDFKALVPLIIFEKLDDVSKQAWHNHYIKLAESWARSDNATVTEANKASKALKFIPVWMNMRDFLMTEVGNLKRATEMREQSGFQMRETNDEAKRKDFCTKCKAFHRLYKCDQFRSMRLPERWEHVNEHKLCVKCLHPPHDGLCLDQRNNKPCDECKPEIKYHNSTLCTTARARFQM